MRFECHIILDFSTFKFWLKRKQAKMFGKPQYHDGKLWGYAYKNNTYACSRNV